MYEMTLNYRIPNANGNLRQHWGTREQDKQIAWGVVQYYAPTPLPRYHSGRPKVTVTRLWGKHCRAFDDDNLYASCKILIDCLKMPKKCKNPYGLGIIVDDTPSHIELRCMQEKSPDGVHRVVITIEPQE